MPCRFDISCRAHSPACYCILNQTNNKIYIGQSSDLFARARTHLYALKKGKHNIVSFQSDYDAGHSFKLCILKRFKASQSAEMLDYERTAILSIAVPTDYNREDIKVYRSPDFPLNKFKPLYTGLPADEIIRLNHICNRI